MYAIVHNFRDEITNVSVRVTMKGERNYIEEDDVLSDLFDTIDIEEDDEELDFQHS